MTREEAIDRLQTILLDMEWLDVPENAEAVRYALDVIEKQKTGHWRDDGEMLWCSNCGHGEDAYFGCYDERIDFNGMKGWARRTPAYCRRCGAKMEGTEKWKETK